jgi:DNA-binding GntR family transcriptional regulator
VGERPSVAAIDARDEDDTTVSLKDQVRRFIEDAIFAGELRPGDKLSEQDFCTRLNTSRTPVREAMLQLAMQGLVEIKPRSGVFVANATHKELLALLEAIAHLEGVAAGIAARRMSPEDRQGLAKIHDESRHHAEAGDVSAYSRSNTAFHELIYKAAGNHLIADMIRNLRRRLFLYRRNVLDFPGRLRLSCAEHGEVLAQVLEGDEAGAQHAMIAHISQGNRAFIDLVMRMP